MTIEIELFKEEIRKELDGFTLFEVAKEFVHSNEDSRMIIRDYLSKKPEKYGKEVSRYIQDYSRFLEIL
jgi:hypothetical protein|tara:strand:+ start:815 stop:1021 length:207 start_codon:yes stop_codon:yes gene_type:complete